MEGCGSAWFAVEPATILATTPVRIENIEAGHCETFWLRECQVEDALLFRDIARADAGAGTLYDATDQHPARSARYREFLVPRTATATSCGRRYVRRAFRAGAARPGRRRRAARVLLSRARQ
jgi:hypothetical protein